jgi:hypothetical protein
VAFDGRVAQKQLGGNLGIGQAAVLAMSFSALVVLAAPLPHLPGASAAPAGQLAGGVIHVYEVVPSLSSSSANDVLTGAITDHGKDHEGVGGDRALNTFVLTKGSFEVNVSKLAAQPPPQCRPHDVLVHQPGGRIDPHRHRNGHRVLPEHPRHGQGDHHRGGHPRSVKERQMQ